MDMSIDAQLALFLNGFAGQSSFGDSVIIFFASYLAYILIVLLIVLVVSSASARAEKLRVLGTVILGALIARGVVTEVIRFFYHRPRPFTVLPIHELFTDSAWSFPSGHATFFFALATGVYLYNRAWGIGFFVAAALMGLARVISGVHYVSDVLAGALIGVAVALVTAYLAPRWGQKTPN